MALIINPNFSIKPVGDNYSLSLTVVSTDQLQPSKIQSINIQGLFPDGSTKKIYQSRNAQEVETFFDSNNDLNSPEGTKIPITAYGLTKSTPFDICFSETLIGGIEALVEFVMTSGQKIQSQITPISPSIRQQDNNFSNWLYTTLSGYDMDDDEIDDYLLEDWFYGNVIYNPNGEQAFDGGDFPLWVEEWQLETGSTLSANAYSVITEITGQTLGCTTQNSITYNPEATIDDGTCDPTCNGSEQECGTLYFLAENYGTDFMDSEQLACLMACGYDNVETSAPVDDADPVDTNIYGCIDEAAFNYNENATQDDGSCYYPITDAGEPFVPSDEIVSVLGLTNDQYTQLIDDTIALVQQLQTELENCPEDQTAEVADLTNQLTEAEQQVEELLSTEGILNAVEDTISQISSAGGCDASSQAVIDSFAALNEQGADSATVQALQTLCAANDNITQADLDNLIDDLDYVYGEVGALYEAAGLDPYNTQDYSIGNYEGNITNTNIFGDQVPVGVNQYSLDGILNSLNDSINNLVGEGGTTQALEEALASLQSIANNLGTGATVTVDNITTSTATSNYEIDQLQLALAQINDLNTAQTDELAGVLSNLIASLQAGSVDTTNLDLSTLGYSQEVLELVQDLVNNQQDTSLIATEDDLDNSYQDGYTDGVNSVDITSDNQAAVDAAYDAAFNEGVASVTPEDGIGQADVDVAYTDGFSDGVNSVIPEDGVSQSDVDDAAEQGFIDGAASVDITSDNQDAFDEGVASVDITSDNQAAIDAATAVGTDLFNQISSAAFEEGVASVDITSDNQTAFDEGVASVDITSDNQTAFDEGVASLADTITELEQQIENLLDASGVDTQQAYQVLEAQLANTEDELAQASANNSAWEDFLSQLDVGMSRLEKFLTDSYGYDVNAEVPRTTLSIPTNMSDVNPNFLNQPLSDTSIYVGDGTTGNSTAYQSYLDEFGFAGKSDEKKRLSGFLNIMGRAKKVKQGFVNFAGQEPFSRVEGNGDEEESTFELTKSTKTGLWLVGGALAAFGVFKLVNKK